MSAFVPEGGSGLAVVGDGSAMRRDTIADPGDVLAALKSDVRLLRDHVQVRAFPVPVTARDAGQLGSALRALSPDTTAIFLARTEAGRARAVQRELGGSARIPVVTEPDTTVMALVAAVLVTAARAGVPPEEIRVVVAGARALPLLVPVLMTAGIGDIASWDTSDAVAFPLPGVVRGATAVIDLVGAAARLPPTFDADVPVVVPDAIGHLLALPGVLRALREALVPVPGYWVEEWHRLDVHCACARALAALTPVDRVLPELADPDLTDVVARAATDVLFPPPTRKENP
jgi:hypothetical protein